MKFQLIQPTCSMCGEKIPFRNHSLQICDKCVEAWRKLILRERAKKTKEELLK